MDKKSEIWTRMFEEHFKHGIQSFTMKLIKKIVDWTYPIDDDEFFKKSPEPPKTPQPEKDFPKLEGRIIDITPIILDKSKQIP